MDKNKGFDYYIYIDYSKNFIKIKHRVRRSVCPNNRVKHGVRQVLFPYEITIEEKYINFSEEAEYAGRQNGQNEKKN